jgi:hypothetical protein
VRDLLHTVDSASMVERVDRRREAAVHAKDAVLHQRGHREVVEQVREVFPHVRVAIFAQALVIETVHLRNLSALVVATGESDAPRVANLKCDQERHTLEGVVTTIDVVTHEQIVCVRGLAADAEELHQVEELAMDITANSDRRLHLGYIRLGGKKLLRFLAQLADALLLQRSLAPGLLDALVQFRKKVLIHGSDQEPGLLTKLFKVYQATRRASRIV